MDRKHRTKAWVTAGVLLFASASALAAGLGRLTVTSTLGQPFRGEIELLAVDKKDIGSIRANFASLEAFREAHIDRSPALSSIRFSVEQKKNGEPYLKVTSTKPIDDPFLDMLVEIDWPSGRLVREYTVLLDPPGYGAAREAVAPVTPPLTKSLPPVNAEQPAAAKPAGEPEEAATEAGTSPRQARKPQDKAKGPAAEESKPAGATYGPVKTGESLSGIAISLKPEGVSLDQMLVALFHSNKQAFSGSNMNRLKAGQILRVPESEQVEAVDRNEAARQMKVQSADWNAYRQKLAAAAEAKPAQEEAAKQSASGKITTAVEDKAAPAKEPAKDVLKLSRSEGAGSAKTGAGGDKEMQGMKAQVQALQEEATAKEKAVKEANQRIADLEKNIKEMQTLLAMKNQSLADLQKQAATAKAPVAAPVEAAKPEEKPAAKPAKPKKPVVIPPKQPEPSLLDDLTDNPLYLGGGAVAVLLLGLLGMRTLAARRRQNVASFEDSIMTSGDLKANSVLGGTGGGRVDTGDTSFLTDFSKAGLGAIDTNEVDPIAEAEVYMAYGRDAQAEEILKEALTKDPHRHEIRLKLLEIYAGRKNLNAFEAVAGEMYAALGGQANPAWDKAAEMGRVLDPDNPLYAEKAAAEASYDKTMIVAGGAAGLIAAADRLDLGGEEIVEDAATDLDFDLDIGEPEAEAPEAEAQVDIQPEVPAMAEIAPAAEPAVTDLGFDFDPGMLAEAEPAGAAEETAAPVADLGLDFNLDLAAEAEAATDKQPEPIEEQESVMEFDLGALTQPAPAPAPAPGIAEAEARVEPAPTEDLISAESWQEEVMSLESGNSGAGDATVLELPDFPADEEAFSPDGGTESIELAAPPAGEPSLDFDFNLGLEEAPSAASAVKEAPHELDLSGISLEMDGLPSPAASYDEAMADDFIGQEVSTKLDLAKAYSDMGDKEGAREILQEVLKEGTDEQQDEARGLIAELG
ncbi:MAG: hypothetical protein PHX38_12915 [Sulfuricella sp.]|nr:hypothetical protein [Sulfuricella sp.]